MGRNKMKKKELVKLLEAYDDDMEIVLLSPKHDYLKRLSVEEPHVTTGILDLANDAPEDWHHQEWHHFSVMTDWPEEEQTVKECVVIH
jgi:hypothetical protein